MIRTKLHNMRERALNEEDRMTLTEALAAIPIKRPGQEVVWANECRLVVNEREADNGCYKTGEMGLCDPKDLTEVQVSISSYDRSARHEIFSRLEGVPVRITIERVPGGSE